MAAGTNPVKACSGLTVKNMVDPNILLQSRPVQVETPLDAQTQAQQVRNLQNVGQLQQGQIAMQPGQLQLQQGDIAQQGANLTAIGQQNQQRAIELKNQADTSAAIQKNIIAGPDGKPMIDHAGVVRDLSAVNGTAALDYQTHATALQQGLTTLAEANEKLNNAHQQNMGSAAGALLKMTPEARAIAYPLFAQNAVALGQAKPGELPPVYDKSLDPKLQQFVDSAITPEQSQQNKTAQDRIAADAARTKVLEDREQDYQDQVTERARHDEVTERISAQRAGTYQDAVDNKGGLVGPNGLTAAQAAVQGRADEAERQKWRKQLDDIHQQRVAYGGALAVPNGGTFVDPKTGKISQQEMTDGLRAEYQQVYTNVTNTGRRLQGQLGVNELPPAPGAPAAAAPQAAAPQASASPYSKFITNGKVRMGLNTRTNQYEVVSPNQK